MPSNNTENPKVSASGAAAAIVIALSLCVVGTFGVRPHAARASVANASQTENHKTELMDLFYTSAQTPACSGDLFLPPNAKAPAPVVVLIHGGGWTLGDKKDLIVRELRVRLVNSGYAVFNINYKLVQQGGVFPNNIKEVCQAVNFLVKNAEQYGIDKDRIALMGDSAGAYLALMAGYSSDLKIFADQKHIFHREAIKCVVAYYPVTDLTHLEKGFVTAYLDDTVEHSPALYHKAEPISYLETAVPTIVIHGTSDSVVPFAQSSRFIDRLAKHNLDAELVAIPGAGHGFSGENSEKAFASAFSFLATHL